MRTVRTLVATTKIDRHGDRFTRESFDDAAREMSTRYVPMLWNHDPRHPPLGRTIRAEVQELEDGEWGLFAVSELFEENEVPPLGDRDMVVREVAADVFTIVRDRSYRHEEDQRVLDDLRGSGFRIDTEEKKALEPLSVLVIAVGAAASMFAAGFLNKMGSDAWDALKTAVRRLLDRKRREQVEFLLVFELQIHGPAHPLSVKVILDSPTADLLEKFWATGLHDFEREALVLAASAPPELRVFVYRFTESGLVPNYAVRRDCVPQWFQVDPP